MRKNKLIILVVLIMLASCSPRQEKFSYVLNNNLNLKTKKLVWGVDQEFNTKRIYSDSNEFSESRLFTGDDNKSIFFRIVHGIWYYNYDENWNLFYNYDIRKGGRIDVLDAKYQVSFKKEVVIRKYILHKITLDSIGGTQSHKPIYYFDRIKGIVIIKLGSIILLRSDSFDKPLTDVELSLL
ncbi:MAG: hypothetical protein EOO20_19655 [Chryseobacterium sp.]|nr:MAG: hypothetical protein EOO20_19655 [Chryseobacterium sp.]